MAEPTEPQNTRGIIPPDLKAEAEQLVKDYGNDPEGMLVGAIAAALYLARRAALVSPAVTAPVAVSEEDGGAGT